MPRIPNYGYGRLQRVHNMEFERMSNSAGPTGGNIVLARRQDRPQVGRDHPLRWLADKNYNNYCSAICCMQSLKFAHLVMRRPVPRVYNFYIDIRTPAKGYDEFYQASRGRDPVRARQGGGSHRRRPQSRRGRKAHHPGGRYPGRQAARIPVDMVLALSRFEPRSDSKHLPNLWHSCSADGWFIERHPKLDPWQP